MAAIAGILSRGRSAQVGKMLERMKYRAPAGQAVREVKGATLGVAWTEMQRTAADDLRQAGVASDYVDHGHFAQVSATDQGLILRRDPLGAAPLYYGKTSGGQLCFASEVKALTGLASKIVELPPGSQFDGNNLTYYYRLEKQEPLDVSVEVAAQELHDRLEKAVVNCIGDGRVGSWLSGGLDSSAVAALARPRLRSLYTFVAGLEGAPDLKYARLVAEYLRTRHIEVKVTLEDLMAVLPEVIYHLESFDALLVRSSITHYLAARQAADYVPALFSGEGGDEFFAGYEYFKKLPPTRIADELVDSAARLHNTALQRVDRCASAFGAVAHLSFLDPDVVDYALRIPPEYKLHHGIEKWILRKAMDGALPECVLKRGKAKFWEGAGIKDLIAEYAESKIRDADFERSRILPGGWRLNTKEELFYYRIFVEQFGEIEDLSWMGRTKGAPEN